MKFNTIEFNQKHSVAMLILNRPDKLNCLTSEMHTEIREALGDVERNDTTRCLVITGKGKGFCAGQDLNERRFDPDSSPDLGASLTENYNPLIRKITSLEVPVICAVNGVAAGAGVGIALACDIVLAARSASFVLSFCKLGLGLDSASSWSLPRLIGLPRAKGLAMLGDKISAEQAEDWGLIWKSVKNEELMDEATSMATHFAGQPTKGLAIIKKELLAATTNSLERQLEVEAELQRIAGRTEDYREGAMAFLEKREPIFKGK